MIKKLAFLTTVITIGFSSIAIAEGNDMDMKVFNKIDKNNDHFITMDELKKHHNTELKHSADVNHDHIITLKEAKEAGANEKDFHKIDSNNDNKISFDEGFKEEKAAFEKDDLNHDGKISEDEFKAHVD